MDESTTIVQCCATGAAFIVVPAAYSMTLQICNALVGPDPGISLSVILPLYDVVLLVQA